MESFFSGVLEKALSKSLEFRGASSLSGGCIHNAFKLNTSLGPFFIKYNQAEDVDMFEKEHKGLLLLRKAGELATPETLDTGVLDGRSYILTRFIESGIKGSGFFEQFGKQLAMLHKHRNDWFGLDHDNYIGRLHQYNDPADNWIDFFITRRLEVQVKLGIEKGVLEPDYSRRFNTFYKILEDQLPQEPASLLHGDLWGGNYMTGADGQAVLIDPAVYYGNREIEMSFTRMFGGFDRVFYESYHNTFPLQPGFDQRIDIYNIYPTLVHLNLFGRSYLSGIDRVLKRYS